MSDNVIAFPKGKNHSPPQTVEEAMASVEANRKEVIDYLVDDACAFVFNKLYDEGFDLSDDHCTKHTALIIESMKSALCATVNIDHPLQQLSDKIFEFESDIGKAVTITNEETLQS
jgi:hypothetical protein